MNKIKNIVIIGGGSSGWITASGLSANFPEYNITLIESSDIPTIGVGESTLTSFTEYKDMIGLKDSEWMPACNATYKLSIDFTNWDAKGTRVKNTFNEYNVHPGRAPHGLLSLWSEHDRLLPEGKSRDTACNHILTWGELLNANNKMTDKFRGFDITNPLQHAYHMDAGLFGEYIKTKFKQNINHKIATVEDIKVHNGKIEELLLSTGESIKADLFVDCSGFSRLLASAVGQPLTKFNQILKNDSAVATRVPYVDKDREMESSTNATTLSSGWVWNIPLYNRLGTGYVYSSEFQSKEDAREEFKKYLKDTEPSRDVESLKFFDVKVHPQASDSSWTKNVVSIGLSGGFIEPLGSTGLHLTISTMFELVNTLKRCSGEVTNLFRQMFSKSIYDTWYNIANFISLHYALCRRYDTKYWKYLSDEVVYKDVDRLLRPETIQDMTFSQNFGFNPILEVEDKDEVYIRIEELDKEIAQAKEEVKDFPTHYQFLKDTIYNE